MTAATIVCAPQLANAQSAGVPRPGSPEADRQALALYEEGSVAFEREDYSTAAARFEAAFERSPRPRILYNLGLAYDRLSLPQQAIDAYERFLSLTPNARERTQVEERLRVLRAEAEIERERANNESNAQSGSGATLVRERVIVSPGNAEPPHTARTVGIVLGSLGLASAGASVAVYFYGLNFYNKLLRECGQTAHVTDPGAPWCMQSSIDDLQLRATLTNGLIATSVGLGVAAGVAIAIDIAQPRPRANSAPPRARAAVRSATIVPSTDGATLVVGGTF